MKVFTAEQIRNGDAYTVSHEPVSSIDLMERAAGSCVQWIREHYEATCPVCIFCGTGNNGGDGLAIARLLHGCGYIAYAYMVCYSERFSEDCQVNRTRLEHSFSSHLFAIHSIADFPKLPGDAVIIDALFGTGLNRPLKGLAAEVVAEINRAGRPVIAIDMPSGLMADSSSVGNQVIAATHTLSFEFYKLAFLMPENAGYTGRVHVLPIGISPEYIENTPTSCYLMDKKHIRSLYKPRNVFSHKGTFGHALLIAGSYGKIGAAVMAAEACLRSGAGLLTIHTPGCGYTVLQATVPEAMCACDQMEKHWSEAPAGLDQYSSVGIGPGIGMHHDTTKALKESLLQVRHPGVLDADALNILGKEKEFLRKIPAGSLLTPHPKEFERLFGPSKNNFERLTLQMEKSREYQIYIILKGHYTCISTPDGNCFFNPTGNAGMATGGSGDVLTGILTGLLAQGYDSLSAASLGVYLHGLAGDIAAEELSQESMIAGDIIACLGKAFKRVSL
jgi:NAD(P)H-hydrate epimerase